MKKVIFVLIFLSLSGCQSKDVAELAESSDHALEIAESSDKEVLFWTCVMHPSIKQEKVGSCPVCKMDLISIFEGSGLTLTTRQKDLIPIRTEAIEFRDLKKVIRAVGVLDYDETQIALVSTRVSGWVEDLHVDFTGINVRENDELIRIYSPELLAAQEEFLTAIKLRDESNSSLQAMVLQTIQAARSKLELYGLTLLQITEIEQKNEIQTTVPLYAPIGGTVIHMNVQKGQFVNRGMNLYRIANLNRLWFMADFYELDLPWIGLGQPVEITAIAVPNDVFHGKISYIYPYLEGETRTQKVQIEVENKDGKLRPGMTATIRLKTELGLHRHLREPFACPMHPWVTSTRPDECRICRMPLESTQPGLSISKTTWTCVMHPEIQEKQSGECPKCGMDLTEQTTETFETVAESTIWICPMHLEIQEDQPGECPKCGMDLTEQTKHDHQKTTPTVWSDDLSLSNGTEKKARDLDFTFNSLGEVLAVPKSAVIDTGLRKVVYIDREEAGFQQIEVKLGPESVADDHRFYPILGGLYAGDLVVTNGNFLLDSQTQLTGSAAQAYSGAIGEK